MIIEVITALAFPACFLIGYLIGARHTLDDWRKYESKKTTNENQ